MCELPDVKFENFAAAKSCLQTTLAPIGAIIRDLAITKDQNGKAKWRCHITASKDFPTPIEANFVAVRAVLNRNVPHRGVLSTITRIVTFSTTETWMWEVTYTTKKTSKLVAAIKTINAAIKAIPSCLREQPAIRKAVVKRDNLVHLEKTKEKKRFFYQLRQSRKAATKQTEPTVNKGSHVDTVSPSGREQPKAPKGVSKTQPYGNFTKGEVILPGKSVRTKTMTHNVEPDYDRWDVKHLVYQLKAFSVQDVKCLHIISDCSAHTSRDYAAAVFHIKNRIPAVRKEHIPRLLQEGLEAMDITTSYLSSFSLQGDTFDRLQIHDHHFFQTDGHILCNH